MIFFEVVIRGEVISKGKPNPEMLRKALGGLKISGNRAIAIDDARSGIVAAKKLGMFTIAYSKYSRKMISEADLNVSEFKEIDIHKVLN